MYFNQFFTNNLVFIKDRQEGYFPTLVKRNNNQSTIFHLCVSTPSCLFLFFNGVI